MARLLDLEARGFRDHGCQNGYTYCGLMDCPGWRALIVLRVVSGISSLE